LSVGAEKTSEARPETTREPYLEEVSRLVESLLPPPRGTLATDLFKLVHARTHASYFGGLPPAEGAAQAASLFAFLEPPVTEFRVRVSTADGGSRRGIRKRTVLETVGTDQPFIVDSLLELARVRGREVLDAFHPIVAVERGKDGNVIALGPPRPSVELLSLVRMEMESMPAAAAQKLAEEAAAVLKEARVVVRDFDPMLDRLRAIETSLATRLELLADPAAKADIKEAASFLAWLRRANFVFLGSRNHTVRWQDGVPAVEEEAGSSLGLLRDPARFSFLKKASSAGEAEDLKERVLVPRLILVHKTNAESPVLRRTRMDYIGIKRLDAGGRVTGEHMFLGLFTSRAYNDLPSDIPILRRKLDEIMERANVVPGSHDHKEMFSIFTSIPKSELFMTDAERIGEMIFTIMSAAGRREVRVSYRPDLLERGVSVMVLLPRERFNPEVRLAIQNLLAEEFHGHPADYRLALSDEPMARLHFYFAIPQGKIPEPPLDVLEAKVAELTRTWEDRLREALEREHGPDRGDRLADRYRGAFPAAYYTQKGPETAVLDIRHLDLAAASGELQVSIAQGKLQKQKVSILKLYRPERPFELSSLMPVLTHLDLRVLDEQTFRITPLKGANGGSARAKRSPAEERTEVYLHSFRVLTSSGDPLPGGAQARRIEETIAGAIAGEIEDDELNALVTRADLDQDQVEVLRSYDAYLHQLGNPWIRRTTYAALRDNPDAARALVRLFTVRFDPALSTDQRTAAQDSARSALVAALARVAGIHEDQILRAFENLVLATVRTNAFLAARRSRPRALAFKVRCADVASMPDPRPLYEIFVHGPELEGVHLRSGKVARGGIRWSSRIDDYRMEILGLMKAQRTKNAVIVPVGAKGGYILKRASPTSPPPEEVRKQYQVFIGAILDVTDNIAGGKVVHPEGVAIHDEDDPYLVVAADRGTASFSDLANEIAVSRSFWLGDAFASGGSSGYNHKVLGITARGAWECVRRHFRELGKDPERETFTVAGIGDMSGDVFGNGMLLSKNIRLLAAFNHVHIFIDPTPDPLASYEERVRLFRLPSSAWTDYDPAKLSRGGGVHRRDAKTVALSPEARALLGVAGPLNGEQVIQAILKLPVDLLWNGGIGTYVKARTETHVEVADPTNNAVRVDGADLRARVVAEGGNLGFTQIGRIEYARAGGRINTDFIDNSGGVDLSDHEVNLKILLAVALERGALKPEERNAALQGVKETVCAQVLRDNHLQSGVLSLAERRAAEQVDEHRFLIDELTATGLLNRTVEKIPGEQEMLRLRESRIGLARPHLAVLLAYAKIDGAARVLASPLPDAPDLESFIADYFPPEITRRFGADLQAHPLRRSIATTTAVNLAINEMGITFFHRLARRTGADFDAILRACLAARELAGGKAFHQAMDRLYAEGFRDMEAFQAALERFRAAHEAATLGVIRRGLTDRPAGEIASAYRHRFAGFEPEGTVKADPKERKKDGLPAPIEDALAAAEGLAERLDLADLREEMKGKTGAGPGAGVVLDVWKEAGAALLIERLETEAARIPRLTAADIQTCDSLLDEARDLRRRLARKILAHTLGDQDTAGADPSRIQLAIPLDHKERTRVARLLESARTREPLTASGLFVIVESLRRMVEGYGAEGEAGTGKVTVRAGK
jgi:glutamate dehydrogenase